MTPPICAFCGISGAHIVGVSDRSARIAGERAEQFGCTPFTDYREMIEATKPEFVIALGRHCDMPEIFRSLVGADVPFVMEKPWGTDPENGLARLAAARGAWVGVPFMSRYSFWAVTVRRMIEAGEFGKISHIFFRGLPDDAPLCRMELPLDGRQIARRRRCIVEPRRTRLRHGAVYYRRGAAGRLCRGQPASAWREVEDYALATPGIPSRIRCHNEVGYTMPTWPANQTDGEQKVAGERLLLRQAAGGL